MLWHGEPGTGKTTALRALIREWKDWCSIDYVADPERLFANTGYLLEVLSKAKADAPADPNTARWRLLIAEDSDEFLRVSARKEAGAALGRLLNLTDGILGQASNALILLTTNERLDRLHPAVVRPGRCLAQVEFTRFSPAEAARWLPQDLARPAEPKTLAELIAYRSATKQIATGIAPVANIGAYL
jgi:SpoVK/Ycf46/Vps4 family AAA+-type ATPase